MITLYFPSATSKIDWTGKMEPDKKISRVKILYIHN